MLKKTETSWFLYIFFLDRQKILCLVLKFKVFTISRICLDVFFLPSLLSEYSPSQKDFVPLYPDSCSVQFVLSEHYFFVGWTSALCLSCLSFFLINFFSLFFSSEFQKNCWKMSSKSLVTSLKRWLLSALPLT